MVACKNHGSVVLVKGKPVVGALGELQSRHVVVLWCGFTSGRNRRHGNVGKDVAFQAE